MDGFDVRSGALEEFAYTLVPARLGVPAVTCSASCTTHVAAASRSLTTVL